MMESKFIENHNSIVFSDQTKTYMSKCLFYKNKSTKMLQGGAFSLKVIKIKI